MTRPYYEADGIAIYHGDAREVLASLTYDALITDPPYGVDLGRTSGKGGKSGGLLLEGYASYEDSYANFVELIVPILNAAIARARRAAVFTGPHIHEQRKPAVIGGVFVPSGAGRHPWGFKTFLPVLLYGTAPSLELGLGASEPTTLYWAGASRVHSEHPCPKPLAWMLWLVALASRVGEMVLDPFAGSGTTLVAARELGRRAIGVELEERYCELAARRLDQRLLPFEEAG